MKKLFLYLGDNAQPYRKLMSDHADFVVKGLTIPKHASVIAEQTHSCRVYVCEKADGGSGWDEKPQIIDTDALITEESNLFLLIRTADCTPVMFYDPVHQAVAAIHSGREGTRKNIVSHTLRMMTDVYQTKPSDTLVWIGAGICVNHYEVSEAVWNGFLQTCTEDGIDVTDMPYRRIDIQRVITRQLIKSGVLIDNITQNTVCTFESDNHFSFRKDGTHNRQINLIGVIDG